MLLACVRGCVVADQSACEKGRKYLRIVKFVDAFRLGYAAFVNVDGDGKGSGKGRLVSLLEVGKWSCLGCFLLLESCTIVSVAFYFYLSSSFFSCYH